MFWTRPSIARMLRALICLALALILSVSYPSQALALRKNRFQLAFERIVSILFNQQTSLDAPVGRARGAAGRGRCPNLASTEKVEFPLTALVPTLSNSPSKQQSSQTTSSSQFVWGLTVEEYPTFWFYIPYSLNEPSELKFAKFVLLDQEKHRVAQPIYVKLPVIGKPSTVGLTLPKDTQPLESDKRYNWYFSIVCDARKPSRNPTVTGWIERISPTQILRSDLDYSEQGIWYDLVTRIAERGRNTYQTQSQTAPLSTEPSTTAPQSQIQNQFQREWLELFQFIVQNTELANENLANENLDEIADELAKAPIIKLTPVPEEEIQLQ